MKPKAKKFTLIVYDRMNHPDGPKKGKVLARNKSGSFILNKACELSRLHFGQLVFEYKWVEDGTKIEFAGLLGSFKFEAPGFNVNLNIDKLR